MTNAFYYYGSGSGNTRCRTWLYLAEHSGDGDGKRVISRKENKKKCQVADDSLNAFKFDPVEHLCNFQVPRESCHLTLACSSLYDGFRRAGQPRQGRLSQRLAFTSSWLLCQIDRTLSLCFLLLPLLRSSGIVPRHSSTIFISAVRPGLPVTAVPRCRAAVVRL